MKEFGQMNIYFHFLSVILKHDFYARDDNELDTPRN